MASIARRVDQLKAGYQHVITRSLVHTACVETGHCWRQRVLDPLTTLRLFMLQILHGNVACRRVRHLAGMTFSLTAYTNARMRLPLELFTHLAGALTAAAVEAHRTFGRWRGHRVLLIDGSGLSMPDTPPLQRRFGQPGRVKVGCGFPVMHVLWLFDAATGLIVDLVHNRHNTHDMADASKLHPMLRKGDVLVGDRGFCSYAHLALLASQAGHGVFRLHQRQIVDFRQHRRSRSQLPKAQRKGRPTSQYVKQLGPRDQLVRWVKPSACPNWMDEHDYAQLPDQLLVRELRYTTPKRQGYRTQQITLVTTLLDPRQYAKSDLADLYRARWQIEINLRHLKQTMGMDVLRCQTVDGVLKELWMFMLVYNLVRLSMLNAAQRQGCDVDRISFIDALDALRHRPPDAVNADLVVNPHRPGRHQPRRIKRPKDRYTYLTRPRATYRLC
jgi:Transposase DDE domain